MLLFNIQLCVLFFGNSFITLIMVESLYNLKDLEGKAFVYGIGVISTIIFSFLPVKAIEFDDNKTAKKTAIISLIVMIIIQAGFFLKAPKAYSPIEGYIELINQWQEKRELAKMMTEYQESTPNDENIVSDNSVNENEKKTVSDNKDENINISENSVDEEEEEDKFDIYSLAFEERIPYVYTVGTETKHDIIGSDVNIILIFMEGLSENIVHDKRAIMPNVSGIMANSINYTNYYNHTFATYRGLEGQLYSGNSLNDQDTNSLVSLMDVLKLNGYYTSFINTEPNNEEFTQYLNAMPFDTIISDPNMCEGAVSSMSDMVAYQQLFDTAVNYNNEGKKFFLAMYSMGTHASFNSFDEVFGDGSSPFLNKFYNADVQFGKFFGNYLNSALPANTMVIFTTDHATYCDEDFVSNCPGHNRICNGADEIPFFIYYQGKKETVDAGGRNSLDMAPTVLDLLGIEKPVDFLGESLYSPIYEKTILDTFFWNPDCCMFTGGDKIRVASGEEKKYVSKQMAIYFSKK